MAEKCQNRDLKLCKPEQEHEQLVTVTRVYGGIFGNAKMETSHSACDVSTMTITVIVLSGIVAVCCANSAATRGVVKLFMVWVDALHSHSLSFSHSEG